MVARYGHSIQLWSADRVVSLGFTASTSGETYTPYIPSVTIYNRSTHQVIASDPNAKHRPYRQEDWSPGVGGPWGWDRYWTSLSISYSPDTGHLTMMVEDGPNLRDEIMWSYDLRGQSFTKARIGTNFGSSPWDATYTYTPPATPVKAATYTQVRLTSYSGHTDGLSSWWMRHKLLAQPHSRGLVAIPHNLTSKGTISGPGSCRRARKAPASRLRLYGGPTPGALAQAAGFQAAVPEGSLVASRRRLAPTTAAPYRRPGGGRGSL